MERAYRDIYHRSSNYFGLAERFSDRMGSNGGRMLRLVTQKHDEEADKAAVFAQIAAELCPMSASELKAILVLAQTMQAVQAKRRAF